MDEPQDYEVVTAGQGEQVIRVDVPDRRDLEAIPREALRRLEELEQRWEERLTNQAQVIKNLSADREAMVRRLAQAEDIYDDLEELIGSDAFPMMPEIHKANYIKLRDALQHVLHGKTP